MKCLQKDRSLQSSTKKMQNPHGEKKKGCTQDKGSLESTMNNKNGNVTSCNTDLEYIAVSF